MVHSINDYDYTTLADNAYFRICIWRIEQVHDNPFYQNLHFQEVRILFYQHF